MKRFIYLMTALAIFVAGGIAFQPAWQPLLAQGQSGEVRITYPATSYGEVHITYPAVAADQSAGQQAEAPALSAAAKPAAGDVPHFDIPAGTSKVVEAGWSCSGDMLADGHPMYLGDGAPVIVQFDQKADVYAQWGASCRKGTGKALAKLVLPKDVQTWYLWKFPGDVEWVQMRRAEVARDQAATVAAAAPADDTIHLSKEETRVIPRGYFCAADAVVLLDNGQQVKLYDEGPGSDATDTLIGFTADALVFAEWGGFCSPRLEEARNGLRANTPVRNWPGDFPH